MPTRLADRPRALVFPECDFAEDAAPPIWKDVAVSLTLAALIGLAFLL